MKSWIIIDVDTGEILAQADGYSEIRQKWRELIETMPDDGHEWSIYERSHV